MAITKQQLEEIFKFQTTADADYTPDGNLKYIIFEEHRPNQPFSKPVGEIDAILLQLESFEHDGYRDRVPLFIKHVHHIPL